jgi:adenylate kinase family enzyme
MITCPNCSVISKNDVKLFDKKLKKQNISIAPINPTCKFCGSEVTVNHTCDGGNIIVLNGTSGSGKTTIAELISDNGFLAIDGDCAIQTLRHKKHTKKYDWNELIDEIICEIDILSLFSENIILSHVFLPTDLEKYIKNFRARKLKYKNILLKPEYQIAVQRCEARLCHETVTPEKWIKHFYDVLVFDDTFSIIDNTNMTPQETMQHILNMPYSR